MNIGWVNLIFILIFIGVFMSCSHTKRLVQSEPANDEPGITIVGSELVIELPLNNSPKKIILPPFTELKKVMDSAMQRPVKRD